MFGFTQTNASVEAVLGWIIYTAQLSRFEIRVTELVRVAIEVETREGTVSVEGVGGTLGAAYCEACDKLAGELSVPSPVAKP